ncbi:putative cytochrome P450 [Biscogniauxia mediterranea]|nr:putative cytochrome P450 [Biscogniauxia mediterranea]
MSFVIDDFNSLKTLYWVLSLIFLGSYCADVITYRKGARFPTGGNLPSLTPRFILNLCFSVKAAEICEQGYKKFKDQAFRLVRSDGDSVVLPHSVLDELSALPVTVASPQDALEKDLKGWYTGMNLILENRLHHSIVQRKLTPRLHQITPLLERKVTKAFEDCFPQAEDWVEFQPNHVFKQISPRLNAPPLVGPEFSDDPVWLDIAYNYTEQPKVSLLVFRTILILRLFPHLIQPLVALFLPSFWKSRLCVWRARRVLEPRVRELLAKNDSGEWDPQASGREADWNVLSWLVGAVRGRDRNPYTVAHAEVLLTFASTHTSLNRISNVLFDLVGAGPGLARELRAEIETVAVGPRGWSDAPYDRLHKLDSLLRESQRTSPVVILGMKRLFLAPHTFKSGLHVPRGTFACMPIAAIENDPAHVRDPEVFDALRYYRLRQEAPDEHAAREFDFSSPTRTSLSFGYGRTACPGRFFASLAIKMVVVKLLTEYEFKFLPGKGRPTNMMFHDFQFPPPWERVLVRRKKEGVCPY